MAPSRRPPKGTWPPAPAVSDLAVHIMRKAAALQRCPKSPSARVPKGNPFGAGNRPLWLRSRRPRTRRTLAGPAGGALGAGCGDAGEGRACERERWTPRPRPRAAIGAPCCRAACRATDHIKWKALQLDLLALVVAHHGHLRSNPPARSNLVQLGGHFRECIRESSGGACAASFWDGTAPGIDHGGRVGPPRRASRRARQAARGRGRRAIVAHKRPGLSHGRGCECRAAGAANCGGPRPEAGARVHARDQHGDGRQNGR